METVRLWKRYSQTQEAPNGSRISWSTYHIPSNRCLWGSYPQTFGQDPHPVCQPRPMPQQHPTTHVVCNTRKFVTTKTTSMFYQGLLGTYLLLWSMNCSASFSFSKSKTSSICILYWLCVAAWVFWRYSFIIWNETGSLKLVKHIQNIKIQPVYLR